MFLECLLVSSTSSMLISSVEESLLSVDDDKPGADVDIIDEPWCRDNAGAPDPVENSKHITTV